MKYLFLLVLPLIALVTGIGRHYVRYFSASWWFLFFILGVAAFLFFRVRRSIEEHGNILRGQRINPSSGALLASLVGAYSLYCIGAILTGAGGHQATFTAIVISTSDARRCGKQATAELADGRWVTFCAVARLRSGQKVQVKLRRSVLGLYGERS